MNKRTCLLSALSLSVMASSASANMNTEDFTEYLNTSAETKGIVLLYLNAAYSAFQVANLELEQDNKQKLFCMPHNLRITEEEMAELVENELIQVPLPPGSDVDVTIVLFEVLKKKFSC